MAYTGDVQPGGPADVRELDALDPQGHREPDGQQRLPARLPGDRRPAARRRGRRRATAARRSSRDRPLARVVTTHQHWDHWRALVEVVAATGAPTAAGATTPRAPPAADEPLAHGDTVAVGDLTL